MSIRLSRRALSVGAAMRELEGDELGGVVLFAGRVRPDRVASGRVQALFYEADRPLALRQLRRLAGTARGRYGARRIVLWHRLGTIPVGDVAVIVGVASAHRARAFESARYLIEELKATVPIWKTDRARPARRPRRPRSRPRGRSSG